MNKTLRRVLPFAKLLMVVLLMLTAVQGSARGSLAAPLQPAQPILRSAAQPSAPVFPACKDIGPKKGCTSLQVFLLIDDSGSMKTINDKSNLRQVGVKNVLDILAREYYLPAVDARAKDPSVVLPDIQVALIHFSHVVIHNSGWKVINPKSLDDWQQQLAKLQPDLEPKVDYSKPQNTDFQVAFQAAQELAKTRLQEENKCPRLVMLFTDGVPNKGKGDLAGSVLDKYMQDLQAIIDATFSPDNDRMYVTAFEAKSSPRAWSDALQQKWIGIFHDDPKYNPRRVKDVEVSQLGPRMEQIVASTIGDQVYTLNPDGEGHFTTEVPASVDSLRLTYFKLDAKATFTVTDTQGNPVQANGKTVVLTGADTFIQVLEITNPAPGAYQIQISPPGAGGRITRLIRFTQVKAQLSAPANPLLQFTKGQITIQLLDSRGQAVQLSSRLNMMAALTLAGQTSDLKLVQANNAYQVDWSPVTADPAQIDACVTITDVNEAVTVLFNGTVGEIAVDPVAVQAGEGNKVCVPSDVSVTIPLQVINRRTQQKAVLDYPIHWEASSVTSPGGNEVSSTITEVDAKNGAYALTFKPATVEDVQSTLAASALVEGKTYPFYNGKITSTGFLEFRNLALSLKTPTLADTLSIWFYNLFHPGAGGPGVAIEIGRRFFGWFGLTSVEVRGRFLDTGKNQDVPGIDRFSVQLVSQGGGKSSEVLHQWTSAQDGTQVVTFVSPGLGLYQAVVTDQGKNEECTALAALPTQTLLLINDFWEYIFWLLLLLLLIWLLLWLLMHYRNRLWGQIAIMEGDQELWKGVLAGHHKEGGHSNYHWKIKPPVCGVRELNIHSWNQRRRWLQLRVETTSGKQTFERSLEHWQDCHLANGCRITWWETESPEGQSSTLPPPSSRS